MSDQATTGGRGEIGVVDEILPAPPMTQAEYEFLIWDGSLAGALAGSQLRFVYCKCGVTPKAEDWHDHLDRYPGARYLDDNGPHEWEAFEREPDYFHDYIVFADA